MDTNFELVEFLMHTGYIKTDRIREAFLSVDRKDFVPSRYKEFAYDDNPIPIGHNQTISAPSVVALMLERLEIKTGMKTLEVGTGSGYTAALLSKLVGKHGKVITVERIPELIRFAKSNTSKYASNIIFVHGDGTKGYKKESPYDRIIITAAIPDLDARNPILSQLNEDGILIAPVGNRYWQNLTIYRKKNNTFKNILPVMFVPLIGEYGFKE